MRRPHPDSGRRPPGIADDAAPGELEHVLDAGLAAMSVPLGSEVQAQMLRYLGELGCWNRTHNLTRILEPEAMVRLHLLDSLTARAHLEPGPVLDVGTGPGLPGIVLALAEPQRQFVLLDRAGKKVAFCRHAIAVLGLTNVEVVHARAEDYRPAQRFPTVVARALARLRTLVDWTAHLAAPGARLIALKGQYPADELAELGAMGENATIEAVRIPGLEVERHIVRCTYVAAPPSPAPCDAHAP